MVNLYLGWELEQKLRRTGNMARTVRAALEEYFDRHGLPEPDEKPGAELPTVGTPDPESASALSAQEESNEKQEKETHKAQG